ncbi:hypothetical protein HN858_05865 [Candidatus Falkowbacteria bacterium]|jgi:hypothetical protein|nr:hypothetical protein [Candidatus Falkowbacteria bacterium]MBT5503314.1 hypothetical protein [Candidatus Falkowbacteria bacterium]MBT6573646.1 hypothetical protein [Candidatus Falkowbacteria bacterium]MBT7349164.1 hypothetical protein [Candidatus Falkowbacteria bacterium]MBT7500117.1 hypothetical protein [Candidatus Falkowbacteria bacterium]
MKKLLFVGLGIVWVAAWFWMAIAIFMILGSWGLWEKPFSTVLGLSEFAYGGTLILSFFVASAGTLVIINVFPELKKGEDESHFDPRDYT